MTLTAFSTHPVKNADNSWDSAYPTGLKPSALDATLDVDPVAFAAANINLVNINQGTVQDYNYRQYLVGTSAATATISVNAIQGTLGGWALDASGNGPANTGTLSGAGKLQATVTNGIRTVNFPIQPWSILAVIQQSTIKFVPGHWGQTAGLCTPFNSNKTNGGTSHASDFFGEMDDMLQDPWIQGYDAHFTWAALDYGYGTFSGSVGGATSGTLTGALGNKAFNGGYIAAFGDSAAATPAVTYRRVQVTGTSVTWSGALPSATITTAHFYYVDVIDAMIQRCKTNYSAFKSFGLTVIPMQFHVNNGGRVDTLTVPLYITQNVSLYGASPDGSTSGWWGQKAISNWSSGTSYSAGNQVAYTDGGTYQAIASALGAAQAPGNTTFWKKIGVVGQYTSATYRPNVALEYGKLGQALGWAYNSDPAFHHFKDQEPSAVAGPANAGTEFGPPSSNDPTYDHADLNYIAAMQTYLVMWVNAFPNTNVVEENTWLAWNSTNTQKHQAWMIDPTIPGRAHVIMSGSADTVGIEYFNAGNKIPSWGLSALAGITVAGSTFSGPDLRGVARIMLDVEQPDIGSSDTTNVNRGVPSTPLSIIQAANSQYQACILFWCYVGNDTGISWRGKGGTISITAVLAANPLTNLNKPGNYP